jgi:hypothetical protein
MGGSNERQLVRREVRNRRRLLAVGPLPVQSLPLVGSGPALPQGEG